MKATKPSRNHRIPFLIHFCFVLDLLNPTHKNIVEEFLKPGHGYIEIPSLDLDPVIKPIADDSHASSIDSNNHFETEEQLKQEKKHDHKKIPNTNEIRYLTDLIEDELSS